MFVPASISSLLSVSADACQDKREACGPSSLGFPFSMLLLQERRVPAEEVSNSLCSSY